MKLDTIELLLVEDNPGDVRLMKEALQGRKINYHIHVAYDGVEAVAFLRQERQYASAPKPDLILLDLNLPKKSGHEVLTEIKTDAILKRIPVIIMTTSTVESDIFTA